MPVLRYTLYPAAPVTAFHEKVIDELLVTRASPVGTGRDWAPTLPATEPNVDRTKRRRARERLEAVKTVARGNKRFNNLSPHRTQTRWAHYDSLNVVRQNGRNRIEATDVLGMLIAIQVVIRTIDLVSNKLSSAL